LNDAAEVVTEHLAQHFVDLRRSRLAAKPLADAFVGKAEEVGKMVETVKRLLA
jgi:hypothetical protein